MEQRSISLILLLIGLIYSVQSQLYEYGRNNGDIEVTTANDGWKQINFTKGVPFYGYLFKKAYINENGLVSMLTPVYDSDWILPFPISGNNDNNNDGKTEVDGADARVIIAPFWSNADVTEGGNVFYRQFSTGNDSRNDLSRAQEEVRNCFLPQADFEPTFGVVVTWADVSFFGVTASTKPTNTFQLVLVSDGRKTFATYIYDEITWNAGTDGPGNPDPKFGRSNNGATIGFNVGDRYTAFSHYRSANDFNNQQGITTANNCGSLQNGMYIYKIDETEMQEAGCKNGADLTVYPSVGSMFGGENIFLVGPCWDSSDEIMCKFSYNGVVVQIVAGDRLDGEKSVCVPDPFFLSSELTIEVSTDGGNTYSFSSVYYVSNLDRLPSSGVTRANTDSENWKMAGNELKITWDSEEFEESVYNVSITALIYIEDGTEGPSWREIYDISEHTLNDGELFFTGKAVSQVYEGNGFGAIRVRSADTAEKRTLWSDVHTFGYLLNQEYQDDPEGWSTEYCEKWAEDDRRLRKFVDDLLPCPCTLQQAIVDTGRFQPDATCSMYHGSDCRYHQGAKHCVRSVAATDTHSGSQCCYDQKGDLMYVGDTAEGSTADRSHVWGAEPYREPGMVPGLSHWKHDVMPYYLCCLWGGDCSLYLDLRPTSSCTEYSPPKTATSFGDPHFVTFDGVDYTFNGKGEFTMVQEEVSGFELQVRTEQAQCSGLSCDSNGKEVNATVITAIAMHETGSDDIHVELNPITELRFIRKVSGSTEKVEFYDQEWLDFNGVSIIVLERDAGSVHKATITYWNSGIGVNVTANGQTLAVGVTLPPELKGDSKVKGILGNWNGNMNDDLKSKSGSTLNPDSATDEQILNFGISWEVIDPYFYYEIGDHKEYQDNDFVPLFKAPDRSELPTDLVSDMDKVCSNNAQCIYDVSMTQDITVGEYTVEALQMHELNQAYTVKVTSCPFLPTPINGTKEFKTSQQNYLAGAIVVFTCAEGLELIGPDQRECSSNGKWSGGGDTECVDTGCPPLSEPNNGEIVLKPSGDGDVVAEITCFEGFALEGSATRTCIDGRWSGKTTSCHTGLTPSKKTGIIVGVVISLIIATVIAICVCILLRAFCTPQEKVTNYRSRQQNTVKRPEPIAVINIDDPELNTDVVGGIVNFAMEPNEEIVYEVNVDEAADLNEVDNRESSNVEGAVCNVNENESSGDVGDDEIYEAGEDEAIPNDKDENHQIDDQEEDTDANADNDVDKAT